jgi:hypothetical protein
MRRGDLTDLTAFVAVADNLSFRAASEQLGVTPSALSHTIRQFEERLGVRSLHRVRACSSGCGPRWRRPHFGMAETCLLCAWS